MSLSISLNSNDKDSNTSFVLDLISSNFFFISFLASLFNISNGATIIEKHFTFNKKYSNFRDHALSADYNDLKSLVSSMRKIEKLLGNLNYYNLQSKYLVLQLIFPDLSNMLIFLALK